MINSNRSQPAAELASALRESVNEVFQMSNIHNLVRYRGAFAFDSQWTEEQQQRLFQQRVGEMERIRPSIEIGPKFGKVHVHFNLIVWHLSEIHLDKQKVKNAMEEAMSRRMGRDMSGMAVFIRNLDLTGFYMARYNEKNAS